MENHEKKKVHDKTKEIHQIPNERTYEEIKAENEHLGRRVMELLSANAELEREKIQLQRDISDLNDDVINSLVAERDEQCESKFQYMNQLKECKQKIKELEDERDLAKNQNKQKKISDHSNNKEPRNSNDSGIDLDLDSVTREINKRMDVMLDEKLSNLGIKINKEVTHDVTEPSNNTEQKIPRHDEHPDTRDQNIIIHGIDEGNEVDYDNIYLKKLFAIIEMNHTSPTIAHRLGMKKPDGPRPMKITMETKNEKDKFMSQLGKLKYAGAEYKKISVTDDYTLEEREEIRRWVTSAKRKNEAEEKENKGKKSYVWKVRGTPKTGMRIVKIRVLQ